jgi:sugar phosphate isomerase/epimerase
MWQLSGFADEISSDFTKQCATLDDLGMRNLELRSAWDTNVVDLDESQLAEITSILKGHNIAVSSIGSPVGKVFLDDDFAAELARMRRVADIAQRFDARFIRMFSFFMRPGTDPDTCRGEVLDRLSQFTRIAEESDLVLIHENEKGIYGDTPRRCLDIVESIGSDHLKATWDPANFVQVGCKPYDDGYSLLRPHLVYMQIKDAIAGTGDVVPAGRGDGQLRETIRSLHADGFDGFFSLEPHLAVAHRMGGFSGPELFAEAWRAFTDLLHAEAITYG